MCRPHTCQCVKKGISTGAPNEGFIQNTMKTLFRQSRVFLDPICLFALNLRLYALPGCFCVGTKTMSDTRSSVHL